MRAFRKFFCQLGILTHRTYGGPQFSSLSYRTFLKKWGINYQISTPYYPQSNGHSGVCVKQLKFLIIKTLPTGDIFANYKFTQGLHELRNTPRKDGRSPAVVLLSRSLCFCLSIEVYLTKSCMMLPKKANRSEHSYTSRQQNRTIPMLNPSHRFQNHVTKKWYTTDTLSIEAAAKITSSEHQMVNSVKQPPISATYPTASINKLPN